MRAWRTDVSSYIRREAKPVDKYGHQVRLYALTRQIGLQEEYDDDVVFAAAWLHDLGVFAEHRPKDSKALAVWDNLKYAMERAPAILRRYQMPEGKIEAVVEAIRTHQPDKDPQSIEGAILRDADILEQIGAMGILRAVAKTGRDTRYPTFSNVIPTLQLAAESLPGMLRLPAARALAVPRVALLHQFLAAVRLEASSELH